MHDSPLVTGQGQRAGYDAGTGETAMVDTPESGRITDAQGGSSIRGVEGAAYKCAALCMRDVKCKSNGHGAHHD